MRARELESTKDRRFAAPPWVKLLAMRKCEKSKGKRRLPMRAKLMGCLAESRSIQGQVTEGEKAAHESPTHGVLGREPKHPGLRH